LRDNLVNWLIFSPFSLNTLRRTGLDTHDRSRASSNGVGCPCTGEGLKFKLFARPIEKKNLCLEYKQLQPWLVVSCNWWLTALKTFSSPRPRR
jgi:hypothetical protein